MTIFKKNDILICVDINPIYNTVILPKKFLTLGKSYIVSEDTYMDTDRVTVIADDNKEHIFFSRRFKPLNKYSKDYNINQLLYAKKLQ